MFKNWIVFMIYVFNFDNWYVVFVGIMVCEFIEWVFIFMFFGNDFIFKYYFSVLWNIKIR